MTRPVGAGSTVYEFGNECFSSDIDLIGPCAAARSRRVDCTIDRRRRRPVLGTMEWLDPGVDWPDDYRIGRRGNGNVELWLGDQAVLIIDSAGSHISYWTDDALDDAYISHLLLDHALPNRLGLLGRTALHGTAVDMGGRACAFVGPTGMGKSTLAASFATSGHALLADDCLLLEPRQDGHWVIPTYPVTRLLDDSLRHLLGSSAGEGRSVGDYYPKHVLGADSVGLQFGSEARALDAIVFLRRDGHTEPSLIKVRPIDALDRLLAQTWYTDSDANSLGALVDRVGAVVHHTRTFELQMPTNLASLGECRDLLTDTLVPSR